MATVSGGVLTGITINTAGTNYTGPITLTVCACRARTATATIGTPINGIVSTGLVTITSGGAGYLFNPAVTIVGGGGSEPLGDAQEINGVVTAIVVTNPGSGYTSAPTIKIAPPTSTVVRRGDDRAEWFHQRVHDRRARQHDRYHQWRLGRPRAPARLQSRSRRPPAARRRRRPRW